MKKSLPIIAFFIAYHACIFSQDRINKIDDSVNVLIKLSHKQNLSSNYNETLKYATLAYKLAKTSNNKAIQGESTICLASAYHMIGDNDTAEQHFEKALQLGKELDNYFLIASCQNGLANIYSNDLETADKAAEYYQEAIKYAIAANNVEHTFITYINISEMYLGYGNADKAYPNILKAEENLDKIEKTVPIYGCLLNLDYAKYFMLKKQNQKALDYIERSVKIAEESKLYLDLIEIYEIKSEIHQQAKDYDLAIASIKKQQYYKDLNFNSEKSRQLEEIKANFEVGRYEDEAKVTKERTRNIIMTALGMLLLAIIVFVLNNLKRKRLANAVLKKKNEELELAKREAERVNQLKSDLLINISHELRTPVYGIIGITSMLMDESKEYASEKELLGALKFSGDNLKNLVNNILRHEEIESKNISLNQKPTNLHQLIIDSVSPFMMQARENQNGLVLNIASAISKVYDIDDDKLSEILVNLISNANKFTNGGKIELKVDLKKQDDNTDTILFTISDTGVGMPEEKLETIFDSFKQVQTNTVYGAGLGLAIAKHLIEAMGGEIDVKSELHKGSEFSFTVDFQVSSETEDELSIMTTVNENLSILVVEDNKINQLVTRKLLSKIGYECTISENGLEAVEACKLKNYDLILMDINMPVMNGLDATKAIKLFKPELTIIALTALEISEIKNDCDEAGLDDVINKPINEDQLEIVINKNLSAIA